MTIPQQKTAPMERADEEKRLIANENHAERDYFW
jgi:hypothetical protein